MFCSKCGKTLAMEDQQCPHCGNPVGESRFEGTPYTSAQAHILPNAPIKQATAAYTRTTYTTMPEDRQQEGDADSRTTYRPVYEGASAPEAVRRDMRAAFNEAEQAQRIPDRESLSEGARDTLNAVDEELKMEDMDTSELHSRPIESTGRAGISAGVEDYIQKLEANQSRRTARKRRNYEDSYEEGDYTAPNEQPAYDDIQGGGDDGQSEVFDDIDEDDFDEMRYGRTLGIKDILKVALIMVLAAALIVGGVMWFRHIRGSKSNAKIEGVTESLYEDGIALVKSHTENAYINDLINVYATEGQIAFANRASADAATIDALLPEEPAVNDSLFVSALQAIQSNLGNAILMDATAAASGSSNGEAESQARWAIVNNSISQLESATTAAELTAILNGEQITMTAAEPTPSPTPEPATANYDTLQKGDKSDKVLELQTRLYMLGFLLDDRDGAFGNKTQTAVKLFQSAAGLEVTGIADSATQAALYADDAPRTEYAQATAEPVPQAETSGEAEVEAEAAGADEAVEETDDLPDEADVVMDDSEGAMG